MTGQDAGQGLGSVLSLFGFHGDPVLAPGSRVGRGPVRAFFHGELEDSPTPQAHCREFGLLLLLPTHMGSKGL